MSTEDTENSIIENKPTDESETAIKEIKRRIMRKLALQVHFISYIIVNILLYTIALWKTPNSLNWVYWTAVPWGLGLTIHTFFYFNKKPNAINIHLTLYVIINAFLLFVDWFPDKNINWFYFAVIGWGIGLIIHILINNMLKPKKGEDPSKSILERKIQRELKKNGLIVQDPSAV